MAMMYTTVDEIIRDACKLRDDLMAAGETEASEELTEVIEHDWTFGSEALMEIGLVLKKVREVVVRTLPQSKVDFIDRLIAQTKKMFEGIS